MTRLLLLVAFATQFTFGATIYWTDWTASTANSATGTITAPSQSVGVTYAGNINFVQTAGGTNYWNFPATYTSPEVSNAPPAADIISINGGLTNMITFSVPVVNPIFAIVSLNGPGMTFEGNPSIQVLQSGCGTFGCGTLQAVGNVLSTVGGAEGHGLFRLNGTFSSITFAGGNENWRGFQVGISDVANSAVPEPGTWMTLAGGLAFLAFRRCQLSPKK